MPDFVEFGDPSRFAIALRWVEDSEPRSHRPAEHGWSMGDLRLSIGGVRLTQSVQGTRSQGHVSWYLSPLIDWLASNWTVLLHEEDFAWRERTGLPAAVACRKALHKWISAQDPLGQDTFRDVQGWYRRHGIRSAAEGGLLPDLFIRRLLDDAELSWNAIPPFAAPRDFAFMAEPAHAVLPVNDVAEPLWEAMRWFANTPPEGLNSADRDRWETIVQKIDGLQALTTDQLQAAYLPSRVAEIVAESQDSLSTILSERSVRAEGVPVVKEFSPMVAMFGGVSPNLSRPDTENLLAILSGAAGDESAELLRLVNDRGISLLGVPHLDGEDFAQDLLEDLNLPNNRSWIDVEAVLRRLGVALQPITLDSPEIRGVALAGTGIAPRIIVNWSSSYNSSEEGRRFTLAHELCHILHDRSRARRVTHVSGPWVAQGFERRANAFAAHFLMPRALVLTHLRELDAANPETIRHIAAALKVSESALFEHLYNLDLINDWERENLRSLFRPFNKSS